MIKQKEEISKEYSVYTTVVLEIIMITSAIKANKDHDVTTIKITDAYLHTKNDENLVISKLERSA